MTDGRNQILISSAQVLEKSYLIPTSTLMLGNILTEETDILFSWQFNQSAPCRTFQIRLVPSHTHGKISSDGLFARVGTGQAR